MRAVLWPAGALALLTFCSPGSDRPETGAAGGREGDGAAGVEAGAAGANAGRILATLDIAAVTEIQTAQFAQKYAKIPAVQELARRLEADHTKNRQEGQALARKLNLTPESEDRQLAAEQMPSWFEEARTSGNFDRNFVEHEIEEHERNIGRLQNELLPAATDPQLRSFLEKTAAKMKEHLQQARQVQKQLDIRG